MSMSLRLLRRAATISGAAMITVLASGQCANDNTAIAGGPINPNCPGTTTVPCVQGGQYALLNVTAGYQYTFATCGATFDTQITLYNNTGGVSLGYNDDSGTCGFLSTQSYVAWTASFTGQLRVLVDQYFCASNTTCAPVTITCAVPPPPVTNGNPCGALPQPLTLSCGGNTFSNVGAGNSGVAAPTCGSYTGASQDVWFSFVAGPTGQVNLQTTAGTLTDGVMAVYSAPSCSGPFTQLACDDDSGPGLMPQLNLTGLNPGQTYYIRFWGYGSATGTFTLCVQGVSSVPPGGCVYTLNLFDSFGDGWGSSNVGVSINGGPFQYYTVTGSSNSVAIPAMPGYTIVLTYNNSGPYQGENSYYLVLGSGAVFSSGTPPAAGTVYAGTLTCVPPPAPPEDCVGSITICSGQSFNNNTNNTGLVADLNLTTAGCLGALERQGTWYNFSPSAGGQIGFTINPANPADDYDFAIWGPFPPGSTPGTICPPLSAPLRCSFAAPSGATGLNFVATDLTEDPGGDKWVRYLDVTVGQVYLLYVSNFSQSGLAFSLDWNLQGGASLDCTILGATLIGPLARDVGAQVEVTWTTLDERGTLAFEVERAVGEQPFFTPLGRVNAQGSPGATRDYRLHDPAPATGLNRYRLKLLDADGSAAYSDEVSVVHGTFITSASVSPNPAAGWAELRFEAAADGPVQVELLDGAGCLRHQLLVRATAGTNRVRLPLAHLAEGHYLARLQHPEAPPVHLRVAIAR